MMMMGAATVVLAIVGALAVAGIVLLAVAMWATDYDDMVW